MSDDRPSPRLPIPEGFEPVVPLEETFDARLGLEVIDEDRDGVMRGRLAIRDELRQPYGLLHGGVLSSVAESLASWGTWRFAAGSENVVMGMSNDTQFLRPLVNGDVHAVATARHRGRTRWLWEVQFRDDADRLCAVTAVNIAIRPFRRA